MTGTTTTFPCSMSPHDNLTVDLDPDRPGLAFTIAEQGLHSTVVLSDEEATRLHALLADWLELRPHE